MRSSPSRTSAGTTKVGRGIAAGVIATLAVLPAGLLDTDTAGQRRGVHELTTDLAAADPAARAKAACGLRDAGDDAVSAMPELTALLSDAAPVDPAVCGRSWWRGSEGEPTSPGEVAAAALVAIGSRAFDPLITSLKSRAWVARRNAAWALGALDDYRATAPLIRALEDREPGVREQAAWALGAIDHAEAVSPLIAMLKDASPRVRSQAAWALGALDDRRAAAPLADALRDEDGRTRSQAAWALGAIDDPSAVPPLTRALKDPVARVREQAAWALGAIGDGRALQELLSALEDPEPAVRRQAAWAIGVIEK